MKNKTVALITALAVTVLLTACLSELEERVTVTFDANGGTPVPSPLELTKGNKLGSVTEPKKGTDVFVGWFNGFDLFTANTAIYNNITLVAKWRAAGAAETVTVTFAAPDSIPSVTVVNVGVGKALGPLFPVDPRKQGYRFDGWVANGATFGKDSVVSDDITVTANWSVKAQFTVTFAVPTVHQSANPGINGKTVNVFDGDSIDDWGKTFPHDMKCAADPDANRFYRFFRWTTDGTNNGIIYTERTPITENVTLTAVYGLNFHPATFNVDLSTFGILTPGTGAASRNPAAGNQSYDAQTGFKANVNAGPSFIWFQTPPALRDLMAQASVANETKIRWEIDYEFANPARETEECYWNFLIANIRNGDNWNATNVNDLTLKDINLGKFDDSLGERPGVPELHEVVATISSFSTNIDWIVVRAGRGAFADDGGAFEITFKSIKIHLVQ